VTDVLVLCYHALSPTWEAALSITPDALERQLAPLVRHGWRSASFSDAVLDPPFPKTLAITFDDAFASVDAYARPILSSLGLTATVFAPSTYITEQRDLAWEGTRHWQETDHASELLPMSWNGLGSLIEQGWEIGSHTSTHPKLTEVGHDQLGLELEGSREECERHLGVPCTALAYPYGAVDDRVALFSSRAGYRVAARLTSHLQRPVPMRWPRVGVYHGDDDMRFRLKASRNMRRLRSSPLWYTHG